jgi:hypothetical protein
MDKQARPGTARKSIQADPLQAYAKKLRRQKIQKREDRKFRLRLATEIERWTQLDGGGGAHGLVGWICGAADLRVEHPEINARLRAVLYPGMDEEAGT